MELLLRSDRMIRAVVTSLSLVIVALLIFACVSRSDTSPASSIGIRDEVKTPAPGSTGAKLLSGLDTMEMDITTSSEETQAWFNQGMALLAGFNHGEAIRSFKEAAARDPKAAMPWWGIAYANGMHINNPEVTPPQWKAAYEAAERALAELDEETEFERAMVRAVAARTAWPAPKEQRPFDEAYSRQMEEVYEQFGSNPYVAALHVEGLMNLQPWDYWTEDLKPKGRTAEFIEILERGISEHPEHPQLAHLYIHAVEAGPNPEKAVPAADMLNERAPHLAGHLVHMPSHIYVHVGRYADAVTSNERAAAADEEWFKVGTEPGFYYLYHAHSLHFLAFASMMEGRYEPALEAARRLEDAIPEENLDQMAWVVEGIIPTTRHVMIRFGKWEEILKEPAPPQKRPLMTTIHHYSRGVALAALGRTTEARKEIALFQQWASKVPQDWWVMSNKAHDVLPIAQRMLDGELAYREGRLEDAWESLSEAIEHEDRLLYDEPPGWMIPVRHSMGALLMEAGQPVRAEKLFREDQKDHPGNGWSLLGLQKSLEKQSRIAEAEEITPVLDKAWKRVAQRPTSSCLCAPNI